MQNGIIKGSGDSRYLKSVVDFLSRYPTYEDFAQALIAGTLPIDLNGINAAGWTQVGTPLNASTLLSDETAAGMGLEGDVTVNDALGAVLPKNGGAMAGVILDTIGDEPMLAEYETANSPQVRNISAGTTEPSFLPTGGIYLMYEEE